MYIASGKVEKQHFFSQRTSSVACAKAVRYPNFFSTQAWTLPVGYVETIMSTGSRMGLLLASFSAWTTSVQLWMDGCKETEDYCDWRRWTNRWLNRYRGALYLRISQSHGSQEAQKTGGKSRTALTCHINRARSKLSTYTSHHISICKVM